MRRVLIAVLSCALLLLPILAAGQQQGLVVSGKVTDEAGNPLPGTNVVLRGFDLGAATDLNGAYRFVIPARHMTGRQGVLSAAFIGYHSDTEEIVLSPGSITVDFELKMDVLQMDAVVVTGVAEATPKTMLPFTVARVSDEQVEMVPATSAVASLQGKVSGVTMVKGSGKPGDAISVRLRTATTIQGSNAPLYIVDGVILGSSNVDIDALDIETIEVVKGAAAASLYGSRAANGVINIKTKRGNLLGVGETRIRFRNEFGANSFPTNRDYRAEHHFYKVAEVNGELRFVDDAGNPVEYAESVLDDDDGYYIQDNKYPGKTYDHLDLYFNPGYFYTNTATISQHKPGTNYLLSLSNMKESGIVDGLDGYGRQSVRLNVDHQVREGLNLSTNAYYSSSRRDDPQGTVNPFYAMMFMIPIADLELPNEDGTPYIVKPDPRANEENPLYAINNMDLEQRRKRLLGGFNLQWAPVRWFNIEGNFSYDRADGINTIYYPNGFKTVDGQNWPTGRYYRFNWADEAFNASVTASFYKNFGDLAAKFKLRGMIESGDYESTTAEGKNLAVNDVPNLGVVQEPQVGSYQSSVRAIGYYATMDLDWQEKYILGLLFRYDGSSLFGSEERWHPYYRGSIAWRVSREDFWFTDKINELKLRYSYGTAGVRPGFSAQYETFSVGAGVISKGVLGNKLLKPSLSIEQEVGLEIAFLDRFALDVTYANTVTKDQILQVPLPAVYGFSSQYQNAGTVESNIIEAELKSFILQKRDMSWSAGLVFDRYKQEITEFNRPPYAYGVSQVQAFYYREGEVFGSMYGYKWASSAKELPDNYDASLFQKNDDGYMVPVGAGNSWKDGISKDLWGTQVNVAKAGETPVQLNWGYPIKYVDADGNDVMKIGDVIPDFSLGFNTTFKWKGLTFYALIDAQVGGDIYNNTRQWAYRDYAHNDNDQAGKPEGEKKPVAYYATLYSANSISSHFVEDGTYAKLRELSVQYSFDRVALGKVFGGFLANIFHRVTVGVIGRNLFTLTNYSGWDPEVGAGDATLMRIDAFGYPQYRTFTGILELEF